MAREMMGHIGSSFTLSTEMEVTQFKDNDYLVLTEVFGSKIHIRKDEALVLSGVIEYLWGNYTLAQKPQISPIANPYATHDMMWDPSGSGRCMRAVARPNGSTVTCAENVDSPIHGGPMPRLIGDTQ